MARRIITSGNAKQVLTGAHVGMVGRRPDEAREHKLGRTHCTVTFHTKYKADALSFTVPLAEVQDFLSERLLPQWGASVEWPGGVAHIPPTR